MAYTIITISREYGSGGRYIGEQLAEKLGVRFYDKEFIAKVAEKTGFAEDYIRKAGEYSPFKSVFSYGLVSRDAGGNSLEDYVYSVQRKIILEIAEQEPCVIVGRCADYILADRADCLNVFIHGAQADKIKRIMQYRGVSEKEAKRLMRDTDKRRRVHYNYYTDRPWGTAQNYDICLDSTALGTDACAELLYQFVVHNR